MRARSEAGLFVTAALAYAVSAWCALLVTRATGGVTSIWIANAVILGFAIRRPHRDLPWLLAAVIAGGTVADAVLHDRWAVAVLAAGCNALEIALVYALLRRCGLQPGAWLQRSTLLVFLVGCVLAAPAIGGALGGAVLAMHTDAPWRELWFAWWRADALGLFIGLPLVWTVQRDTVQRVFVGPDALVFWSLAALTVATVMVSFAQTAHPFVLSALPLLAVAVWTGAFGTALCNALMIGSVLLALTLRQRGLLPDAGAMHSPEIGALWLYACISAVGPLIVAFMTEQRALDRARVERARARLQEITDRLPARVAEIGPDLRYRFANAQFRTLVGIEPSQIIGRTPREVLGDALEAQLRPHLERARQGHHERFEVELADGTVHEAVYEPLPDTGGFLVLSHDITWRRETDRRLRMLLESMPDAMLVIDAKTHRIVLVNEAAERMFGMPRDGLLGAPVGRFVEGLGAIAASLSPDDVACGLAADHGVCEVRGQRADGSAFPAEALLRHIDLGELPQCVVTLRDVTARRQAEQILQRERERAQVTLNSISDAVVTYSNRRRVTSLNPVAEQVLGWSRDDAIGTAVDEVVRMQRKPGDAPVAWQADRLPGTPPVVHEVTGVLCQRDGGELRVALSDAPLSDEAGHVIGGVVVIRDVSQAHAMAERMAYLAQHDHLTGLPNRAVLDERLNEVLAQSALAHDTEACGALLFLDLDHFKRINDSLGHQAGDAVLRAVAQRLQRAVRATDTVSRQGGDEFVILLPSLPTRAHAAKVAKSAVRVIELPVGHEGHTLHVSASVGIAVFPEHGRSADVLTKYADSALYEAKRTGRGRVCYFNPSMSANADRRLRLETELRAGITEGRLVVEYQPKVAMPSRALCGAEVLVRRQRTNGSRVLPDEFVPVAEETGLITAIDEWVMHEACRQARAWIDAGLPALPLSINVSLARLDPARLLRNLHAALDESGLTPGLLEVEFTESQMMGQHVHARRLVDEIRELGVRMAVDDFGTGYSSLSYLTEYRFDTIKIDRAFVRGLPTDREHQAIARAILTMAESLECTVVAEGVESDAQADALVGLGCRQMQGYLFAPPLPAAALEAAVRRSVH